MSEYGEPDARPLTRRVEGQAVKLGEPDAPDITESMGELARRERCAAALAGIEDPEQFMADVRELMQKCMEWLPLDHSLHEMARGIVLKHDETFTAEEVRARLAAQLKGEG